MSSEALLVWSEEAEQSVIGALLVDGDAYYRVGGLVVEDFFDGVHRRVYGVMTRMFEAGEAVDLVTVNERLMRGGKEADGVLAYLGRLVQNVPGSINIDAYATVVVTRARSRQVAQLLGQAQARLARGDVDEVVNETMAALQVEVRVSSTRMSGTGRSSDKSFSEAVDEGVKRMRSQALRRETGEVAGVSTTIKRLDAVMGGLDGPRVYVLGGRPGTYKSAFAWQMLMNAAAEGQAVGVVSLEMGAWELAHRAFANVLEIDSRALASGEPQAMAAFDARFSDAMREWPIRIDDVSRSLHQITTRIMAWKHQYDMQLVVIDHVQLITTGRKTRFEELSEISRALKGLAMTLDMPILVLSQLSRDVEKQNRRPILSDIRECGNLEQDADVVIFTWCEQGSGAKNDRYELILAKQRGGPARELINIKVEGAYSRLLDVNDQRH